MRASRQWRNVPGVSSKPPHVSPFVLQDLFHWLFVGVIAGGRCGGCWWLVVAGGG